jgi:hypothetical protein
MTSLRVVPFKKVVKLRKIKRGCGSVGMTRIALEFAGDSSRLQKPTTQDRQIKKGTPREEASVSNMLRERFTGV